MKYESKKPGFWFVELGDHENDPDMVKGIFEDWDSLCRGISKYSCAYVKIDRRVFTDPERF